jgi:predicted RNase H-like HicB family nuclease
MARKKGHKGILSVRVSPEGTVEISASISGDLFKQEGMWISNCPALDLATCGKTKKEALENTKEAVRIFFETCIQHRTLEKALDELHWQKAQDISVDGLATPKGLCRPAPVPPAFVIDRIMKDGSWKGHVSL